MRKLQQVALIVAAAGGLSAIGAGTSFADAPVAYNGAAPPPVPQPDAQAASRTSSTATAQTSGSQAPQQQAPQQAAPQRPAEVSPQINPQMSPQLNPHISSEPAHAPAQAAAPQGQNNLFRPYQECSPQSLLDANLPVAVLANAETRGVNCTQANSQANAAANAH